MCEHNANVDARATRVGQYSAWLAKVKGDGARTKWFSSTDRRYFTLDFDARIFSYAHSEDRKKISQPIPFKEIVGAEQLPQTGTPKGEFVFGFSVITCEKTYELYTITYLDAKHWVDGLNAARDIGRGLTPAPPAGGDRQLSHSSLSTTADGSEPGSGNSSGSDRGFAARGGAPPPWAPQPVQRPLYRPPAPAPAPAPVAATPVEEAPPPAEVDPFAALDMLEELAGPVPTSAQPQPYDYQAPEVTGQLLREARALVTEGKRPTQSPEDAYAQAAAAAAAAAEPIPPPAPPAPEQWHQQAPVPAAPLPEAPAPAPAPAPQVYGQPPVPQHAAPLPAAPPGGSMPPPPAPAPVPAQQLQQQYESWDDEPARPAPGPPPGPPGPPAHAAPPAQHASQADEEWDSEDDAAPAPSAYNASWGGAPPGPPMPPPPPAAPASGFAVGAEASEWDEEVPGPPPAPQAYGQPLDTCGAPMVSNQGVFVEARTPAPAPAAGGASELDDLVGELIADGGSEVPAGTCAYVPNLHCTNCDFQVLRISGYVWGSDVDYMFVRNHYPNAQRLHDGLVRRNGCFAYACQCSWRSADARAEISDVTDGLRWRQL